jgi:hypothetical protein
VEVVTDRMEADAVWIEDAVASPFARINPFFPARITAWSRALAHAALTLADDEWLWLVEDDVAGSAADFAGLVKSLDGSGADLASIDVMSREQDPSWPFWRVGEKCWPQPWRSFNPLCRLSPRLLREVDAFCQWRGEGVFMEVMFASVARASGFSLLDLRLDPSTRGFFGAFRYRPRVRRVSGIVHPFRGF